MISVLSCTWVAPSLLGYGDLMGLVTPSFPKSMHVFKDVKFEFELDLPVSCLVSPSIPLELGLNDSYVLSGSSFVLPFWNFVDDVDFPDPAASTVLRTDVVCRNVMPSSRSCTFNLFALVCALAFCGRWLLGCLGIPNGEYAAEQSAALFFMNQDQVCSRAAASLVSHGCCVAFVFFNFLASVFANIFDIEQMWLGSCEILGKSQSKDMKDMSFRETLCLQPQQGDSLIGAAAAWASGAFSYFLKQIMCLVTAACTSLAFCYFFALEVMGVLQRLGQFACILVGAAAAWTLDASSYFQKQVAAACTIHAFCYIISLDVLGQSACILVGAAAAWMLDVSSYFQKQVAAACTILAFCFHRIRRAERCVLCTSCVGM